MDGVDYLHMQLRLEGISVQCRRSLLQVEPVPGEDVPLMIVVQFADRQVVDYYDEALPPELQGEIAKLMKDATFPDMDLLSNFLRSQDISFEAGHYKTYVFPPFTQGSASPDVVFLSRQEPRVQAFGFGDFAEEVFVMERDGRIASACVSIREDGECGEAWVYTDPAYRNYGCAQSAVSAWARHILKAGKVPLYSHKIANTASAHVAKRLRLQPVFEEISISYSTV